MKTTISKHKIDALKAGTKDVLVWDTRLLGFGCKVTPAGRKIYVLQYRSQGRVRRFTIGPHGQWTPETARKQAHELLGQLAKGEDPQAEKAKGGSVTLTQLAERYFSDYAELHKKHRSITEDRRNLHKHVLPTLGEKLIENTSEAVGTATGTTHFRDITSADIAKLHRRMKETPVAANRVLALLTTMFNLAENERGWNLRKQHTNPCYSIKKYKERKRQRYLSESELSELGEVLRRAATDPAIYPPHLDCIRLLIFTGARKNELVTLQWKEVDMGRHVLQLHDSKTGPKVIHLSPPALEVLSNIRHIQENPHVFPGVKSGRPIGGLQNTWSVLRKKAKLADVHLHDLRHSYASIAAVGGLSLPTIGKLLGHTRVATTERYAHLSDDPLKKANDYIGDRIHTLMSD